MLLSRRRFSLGLLVCPLCAAVAQAADGPHWDYEGHGGAQKWGELTDSFKTCEVGTEQSPINLSGSVKATLDPLQIDWRPQAFKIVNNGHTIQANAAPGSELVIGKDTYPNFPNWGPDFGILSAKAESLQGAMRRKRM
jgi:carbonic anhydrase